MPALLALPEDAARRLVAFLDAEGLEHTTSTSRAASWDSCFQRTRDARGAMLTLPHDTTDVDRCRHLIRGIHRRNPLRLASLLWIQVFAPWQVEVLLEDPAIAECVHSVRVRTTDTRDSAIVRQMCEMLRGLTRLRKVDVSCTPLDTVDAIAGMTQLRELDLSRTNVTDVSAVTALTELRALVLDGTIVTDLQCIEQMAQLEVLRVSLDVDRKGASSRCGQRVMIPSLRAVSGLHTVVLDTCAIENTADLLHVAPSLRRLELTGIRSRRRVVVDEDAWPPRNVAEDELLRQLVQLETILLDGQDVLTPGPSALTYISSLCTIQHAVFNDLLCLTTLQQLEEINLTLPEGDNANFLNVPQEDYTFLLQLPRVRKIKIKQTTTMPRYWVPDMQEVHDHHVRSHAMTLAEVLPRLPNLTSLDYSGYIPNETFLLSLKHLQHLTLHKCVPEPVSFDWIRGFQSLRSLDLTLPTTHSDLSAVGELSSLESFRLFDTAFVWDAASHGRHQFLAKLGNLKSLELCGYMEPLDPLRGMSKLESLVVRTSYVPLDTSALRFLVSLRKIDIANTNLRDLSPLVSLPRLREAIVHAEADCRPLVGDGGPPRLLRVLHPERDCIARCHHREVLTRREWESRNAVHDSMSCHEDKGVEVFGRGAEDY